MDPTLRELKMRIHLHRLRECERGAVQTVAHKGAVYTVTAIYAGSLSYIDLVKRHLLRDMEIHHEKK